MADIPNYIPKYEDMVPLEEKPSSQVSAEPMPTETPSQLEAAARGIAQGATMGFSEEAIGAAQALAGKISGEGDLGELYRKYRDIQRAKEKAAQEAFPKTYGASQIGGAVGTALIPGLGATKLGALISPTTLRGAAAAGAVAGIGGSEADLTKGEVGGLAGSAALGGVTGAIGHKIGQAISKYFSAEELEKKAATNVADILQAKGLPSKREQIGEAFLKSDILKNKNPEEMLKAVAGAKEQAYGKLEARLAELQQQASNIDFPSKLRDELYSKVNAYRSDLLNKVKDFTPENLTFVQNELIPNIDLYLDKILKAENNLPRLQEIKRALTSQADDYFKQLNKLQGQGVITPSDFKKADSLQQVLADIGLEVKNHMEDVAEVISKGAGSEVRNINRNLGGLIQGERLLTKKLTQEASEAKVPTSELSQILGLLKPGIAVAKKIGSTIAEEAYEPAKYGMAVAESGLAKAIKQSPKLQKVAGVSEEITKKAGSRLTPEQVSSTGKALLFPSTQESSAKEEPAKSSKDLMSQKPAELYDTLAKMQDHPELESSAFKIQQAMDEKDNVAINARLMALIQDPRKRTIINQLISQSKSDKT